MPSRLPLPVTAQFWQRFGLAPPACPVRPDEKEWLERGMAWLAGEFGAEALRTRAVVLPTPEFFPVPYRGSEEDVPPVLRIVCAHMGVDFGKVGVRLYTEQTMDLGPQWKAEEYREGSAGLYLARTGKERFTIKVERKQLAAPASLVATLAHELAHVRLLGEKRIPANDELLTDLATVFFGLGVFTANTAVQTSTWSDHWYSGWSVGRQGYMTQPMFGYALALFAHFRREANPRWAKHLTTDIRAYFQQGLRYLRKTGHTTFGPAFGLPPSAAEQPGGMEASLPPG